MEFKQVNVGGYDFHVAKVTKLTVVSNYVSGEPVLAAEGDFVVRDRFFNLYVMTPAEAKSAFGHRLEVFE